MGQELGEGASGMKYYCGVRGGGLKWKSWRGCG